MLLGGNHESFFHFRIHHSFYHRNNHQVLAPKHPSCLEFQLRRKKAQLVVRYDMDHPCRNLQIRSLLQYKQEGLSWDMIFSKHTDITYFTLFGQWATLSLNYTDQWKLIYQQVTFTTQDSWILIKPLHLLGNRLISLNSSHHGLKFIR